MPLLSLDAISLSYGLPPLLDGISFTIERGERLCLLGRNGCGKSTLLRIIAGEIEPDSGHLRTPAPLRIARLEQDVPGTREARVFEVVAEGLGELGALVRDYFHLSHTLGSSPDEEQLARLARLQQQLEDRDGWVIEQRVERVISRLGLDGETSFAALSGGWQRRVLLARALVVEPDLLLLDEPTNHLDLEMRLALGEALQEFEGALVVVSHDRHLLRVTCDTLWLVDRGRVEPFAGDLDEYPAWLAAGDPQRRSNTAETAGCESTDRRTQRREAAEARRALAPLRAREQSLERELAALGERRERLDAALADPALYDSDPASKSRLLELAEERRALDAAFESAELAWLEVSEALETARGAT